MDVVTLKQERVSRAAQRRDSRDWRGSASLLVIAVAALAASRTPAGAQAFWTGTVDQNWFNAGNWDTNAVPNAATDATVPHGPSNQPLVNGGIAKTKALVVGSNTGLATLGIINGGTLTSIGATLGVAATSHGIATIAGAGSSWTDTINLQVGLSGSGEVKLGTGGLLKTDSAELGVNAGSSGIVTLDGTGTVWNNTTSLTIGRGGVGSLTITNGGHLTSDGIRLADQATSTNATLTIDGAGSSATVAGSLRVGFLGTAKMAIKNGGTLNSGSAEVGREAGAEGAVDVEGAGSTWTSTGSLVVGDSGRGFLAIFNGGQVSSDSAGLATQTGSYAEVGVNGAGARWNVAQKLSVGVRGEGKLFIDAGGVVTSESSLIGDVVGAQGSVSVQGAGSTWTLSDGIAVGQGGTGILSIANGGFVSSLSGSLAGNSGGLGTVTVAGAGSKWSMTDALVIGNFGEGLLDISAGGEVSDKIAIIGRNTGSKGTVKVYGAGSTWTNTDSVYVGGTGAGTVILSQAGKMTVGGDLVIGSGAGDPGTVIIGGKAGAPLAPGSLTVGITAIGTNGSLVFNHTDTNYQFASRITGAGQIAHLGGTTLLTGPSSSFTGTTAVSGGTLLVNDSLGGTVDVQAGGALGGSGTVFGPVSVAGRLVGQSGQVLRMNSLALGAAANIDVALGTPSTAALFRVTGNLTLDGTLNVTDAGGFGLGVYGIFNYGGALTDNGLAIGALPAGMTGTVQTAVANQVNLVVNGTGPGAAQFWNGTTTAADGVIHGGAGVWSAGAATNWTDATGTQANVWGGNFAIFQNNPAAVTVDGSAGAVATTGMQFIGQGWTVFGAPVTLNGAGGNTIIRVGNGTAGGASHVATIGSELTGASRLVKNDLGTLILTGANSYSGGTTVNAGLLQIGNGSTTGSITGDVLNNAGLAFNRANNLSYGGVISGNGTIRQAGAGKTELTGDSSGFAGTTTVENGTLAVNGKLGGSVSVLAGGHLGGSGTVGNLQVTGTAAPGNSIGTLNVGSITFNPGSTYEVEIDAAGASDRIAATGTATINGGAVKVLAGAGNYAPQTQYTILTAAGGRSGSFTGGVTSNLAFLTPSLGYDANNVYLTMTRNSVAFANVGLTWNQVSAGSGVESLGQGNPVYNAVLNLSPDQARGAFDQLSGEIHASARTALVEDSRFLRNAVNDRLRAASGAAGAAADPVVTYQDGRPVAAPATSDRLALWGQGFGSWGRTDGDGNAAKLERRTGGFFIGADAPILDRWRLGAVAGYSRTSFDVKGRHASGDSDNYHLGLYGGANWGALALRTGAAYTWHDVSTRRTVGFPGFGDRLTGDYNAATAQLFGELAYGFSMGATRFEPFANLAYVSLHTDGFRETGGAAALTGAAATTDATFTTLGLRAQTTFMLGGASLTAKGTLGWRHAFGDVTPLAGLRFAGGGSGFGIGGVPIARNAAVIEAGLDYAIAPNATLGLSYGGQFGSGLADHAAKANFNVRF